jgi:hypothetical protein
VVETELFEPAGGLDAADPYERRVQLHDYDELNRFGPLRRVDSWLHDRGLPHPFDLPARLLAVAAA